MGKKERKQDPIHTDMWKNRKFSSKKESFEFEWVVDSAVERKRKGKSGDGVESSKKMSKFEFDGFVMLSSSESTSLSDDECCPRKEVVSPSSVKPGPPKRGRGRPRKHKRNEPERIVLSDEDVVVINCDENDVVHNVGENDVDTSVFGESGVRGSENSVVRKKCVSVGVQAEDDQNFVIKKFVSVGVQVSEEDWKYLDFSGNDGGTAAKSSNANLFKDLERGEISDDDAFVLSGDIEYITETSGSYTSVDEVSPCESGDEDSKFCQANSVKVEDCSEQGTSNLNCVARRTRSHFTRADMKLGTFSRPFCLGDDDDDLTLVDSSTDDDAYDNGHCHNKKSSRKKPKGNQKRHNQDSVDSVKGKDHDNGKRDTYGSGGGVAYNTEEDEASVGAKPLADRNPTLKKRLRSPNSEDNEEDEPSSGKAFVGAKPQADMNPPMKKRLRSPNSEDDEENEPSNGKAFVGAKPFADSNPTTKKRVRSIRSYDGAKILIDSMLENKEIPVKEEMEAPTKLIRLPTKFWYPKEPEPPEKSEYEELWNELDLCLACTDIGSAEPDLAERKSDDVGTHNPCVKCGRDGLILDEEVGLKCKYCSYLQVEIRDIAPEFDTFPFGKGDWRASLRGRDYFFKGFSPHDSLSTSQDGGPSPHTSGTVWDLIPGIRDNLYPHQQEGFEFIWRNIAGSTELDQLPKQTRPDGGSGCIISHAPGTGKTRLTIVFLQAYMKKFPTCRPVIIAPRSMLLTWEEEFQKWGVDVPFHNLNKPEFSGKEREIAMQLRLGDNSPQWMRLVKLYSWSIKESILGISYTLFEKLAGERKKKKNHRELDEDVRKILLEFPGLLILDEGHTPRNDQSLIWKVLCQVQTQRRIILSGTPFQNNFEELLNTLYLVRPKISETLSSGSHVIKRGRKGNLLRESWATLTNSIGKDKHALKDFRKMIDPFVHVHNGTILQQSLPGLRDSVVILKLGELQKTLLEAIKGRKNPLDLSHLVSLLSVHPSLFPEEFDEVENGVSIPIDRRELEGLKNRPEVGVKTKFLIELVRLSCALKEKVLVFSQFIDPLTLIMEQLSSCFHWTKGKEILYMDGQIDIKERQHSINKFNSPNSEVRVLLASLKACSEGINLVGASRVVLLDVVWNPSVEWQALSRAYRLGQKNMVHVYHLVASDTYEEEKYCRQLEKDRLSKLVFSSSDVIGKGKGKGPISSSEDQILREMLEHPKLNHMFERIIEQPKERNLVDCYDLIDFTGPQT